MSRAGGTRGRVATTIVSLGLVVLLMPAAARADAAAGGAGPSGGGTSAGAATVERAAARDQPGRGVALSLLSLHARGLDAEGELRLSQRYSVAAALGVRSAAAADYSSLTVSAAGEVRRWLRRRAVWSSLHGMVGWYLAGRLDLARTSEHNDTDDRDLGAHLAVAGSFLVGYRFAPWRGLTITPSTGLSLRTEFDLKGRLAPWTQAGLLFSLTAGWLF